jgi:hypothetical protein
VFDGKPPAEKINTICHRREQRQIAATECVAISTRMQDTAILDGDRQKLVAEYAKLRRSSVTITRDKIESVKKLFDEQEVPYCTAPSEADALCATMVLSKDFWGCMSDDMDMLVYGCAHIIRDLNMHTHTAQLYVLPEILQELNITYEDFKRVCVISGTDYNTHHQNHQKQLRPGTVTDKIVVRPIHPPPTNITFYAAIKLFSRYRQNVKYPTMNFYGWLKHYIKFDIDYIALDRVYNMFSVPIQPSGTIIYGVLTCA